MYENRPYRDLPWWSPTPSEEVVGAVRTRFFPKGGAVLDVGCGAGSNLLYLARRGYRAAGVDLAPKAIAAALERAERAGVKVDARIGDALNLPFPAGRFDAANDRGCYHTLPIPRRREYAAELARVVRPGGKFLVTWVGREETKADGPPHRPSVEETTHAFEKWFLFQRVEFYPPGVGSSRAGYVGWLERRQQPQPPPR
jgi:SAM-dependent methyltransferase